MFFYLSTQTAQYRGTFGTFINALYALANEPVCRGFNAHCICRRTVCEGVSDGAGIGPAYYPESEYSVLLVGRRKIQCCSAYGCLKFRAAAACFAFPKISAF